MKNRTNSAATAQTALLILPRLFAFFCADAPYSAAGALGVLLAVIPQAAAALLLTRKREPLTFSPRMLRLCRCGAVLYAADLTVQFQRLCRDLLLPHCGMMLLFLGALLLYALVASTTGVCTAWPACRIVRLLYPVFHFSDRTR